MRRATRIPFICCERATIGYMLHPNQVLGGFQMFRDILCPLLPATDVYILLK